MRSLTYNVVRRLAAQNKEVSVVFDGDNHIGMLGIVEREVEKGVSTYRVVEHPSETSPIGFLWSLYCGRNRISTLSHGTLAELDGNGDTLRTYEF